ncbi:MAG: 4Fe-4S binding protein [Deltaproteobacteria bacterium]|nr:4Fe-4S binding protein [Deltaproteobacteria bacterium]
MGKFSLVINKKDCTGCHSCEIACKQEHSLRVGPRLVRIIENGPNFIPVYCHHCAKAPCREACPVDAISRNEQGIVLIDKSICIGCMVCIEACPFEAMQFDDDIGIAVKCDLCIDRLAEDKTPACVSVCPTGCISLRSQGSIAAQFQGAL